MRGALVGLLLSLALTSGLYGQGTEIGFVEDFALAPDRAAVLERLVPGTEPFYYYRALERQHAGQLDQAQKILDDWEERRGRESRLQKLRSRQALLRFRSDPERTWTYLRDTLGLDFEVEPPRRREDRRLSSRLNPDLVDTEILVAQALEADARTFSRLETSALARVVASDLPLAGVRTLLQRLGRADIPGITNLVVKELRDRRSRGFGSLRVHRLLTKAQLDSCLGERPELLSDDKFVAAYLRRLAPRDEVDLSRNAAERRAHLDRLRAFADRLPAVHNSLKAHVLYRELSFANEANAVSAEILRRFLRLPRRSSWAPRPTVDRRCIVDPRRKYDTGFAPIGDEEPLIRRCLMRLLKDAASPEAWRNLVRNEYLDRLFAEAKILGGQGDPERWASMIDNPSAFQAIKERVEVNFAANNARVWGVDDAVTLQLEIKNVPTLLVKIFEIDAGAYYARTGRELDARIDLEGVIPAKETQIKFGNNPFLRLPYDLSLPDLEGAGAWVVELIGNGLSSRAVITKGGLSFRDAPDGAGHRLRVFDERQRLVKRATVRLDGRSFSSDAEGDIRIPYSRRAGKKPLILEGAGRAALTKLQHLRESYRLAAGFHIERESVLRGGEAQILVRPTLTLAGRRIPVQLLEDPVLEVEAVSRGGLKSTMTFNELKLEDRRDTSVVIAVPDELSHVQLRLRGRIDSMSDGKPQPLASSQRLLRFNAIASGNRIVMPLLTQTPEGYVLEFRGRNGEVIAERTVALELKHRDIKKPIRVRLETDQNGSLQLGALDGISSIEVDGYSRSEAAWALGPKPAPLPSLWTALAGETISVPVPEGFELSRSSVSLLEYRDGVPYRDHHDALALDGIFLDIEALPAGDHRLHFHASNRVTRLDVIDGVRDGRWLRGAEKMVAATSNARLQLAPVEVLGDTLLVRVANAGPDARVHLVATRFVPSYDLADALAPHRDPLARAFMYDPVTSHYVAGRRISDEYRYILERRLAQKFPGNMLPRPGLVLNPWALEETNAALGLGGGAGGRYGGRRGKAAGAGPGGGGVLGPSGSYQSGAYADLDFLAESSTFLVNLRPNARGEIRIPLKDLGEARLLTAIAVDDDDLSERRLALAGRRPDTRDLRLSKALAADRRLAETRTIDFLAKDAKAEIELASSSRVEILDDLASVFRFFRSRIGAEDLSQFDFLLEWPELDAETRLAHYDECACHELHVFLYQKDRAFFDAIVRPFLANKRDRTFIDRWLLEENLDSYLEPWAFSRLNIVEKILLLQRQDGGTKRAARYAEDLWKINPEDPSVLDELFAATLAGDALANTRSDDLDELQGITGGIMPRPRRSESARRALENELAHYRSAYPPSAAKTQSKDAEKGIVEEEYEEEPEPEEVGLAPMDSVSADARGFEDMKSLRKKRARRQSLFRDPDPTQRLIEHNWWHRRRAQSGPGMIKTNAFWRDFAAHTGSGPFVSKNFTLAGNSFAEVMLALSFLDLPFRAEKHEVVRGDLSASIRASSPLLLLTKQLRDAQPASNERPLILSQTLYVLDPRTGQAAKKPLDLQGGEVVLRGVPYLRRVAITNPTPSRRRLEFLTQAPEGSIPLAGSRALQGRSITLAPFATLTYDDRFYFPAAGTFGSLPPQAAEDGRSAAAAQPITYAVQDEAPGLDRNSWPSVARDAELPVVLEFLEKANLSEINLGRLTWRMRDRASFRAVTEALRGRLHFHDRLWSFAILHRDEKAAREYLAQNRTVVAACGPLLESPLLTLDPVARETYEMAEFSPIINPRAHRFGARPRILDEGFAAQYLRLLELIALKPQLGSNEHLAVTRYLLMQDRIGPALEHFALVRRDDVATKLQYDYLGAYLAFFGDNPERARAIADRYSTHPVARWRERFDEVRRQLDEARGQVVAQKEEDDPSRRQGNAAAEDPSLALEVEGAGLVIDHRNLEGCRVAYYAMDAEFLFSSSPFVQNEAGAFAYVKPTLVRQVRFAPDARRTPIILPERFANANILVEVRAAGLVKRRPLFSNTLSIAVSENFGQVQVSDEENGRPLKATYVKVFAQTADGSVRFHKDGYTDLRGRFDYVSLTGPQGSTAKRFALLIVDEERGAEIREVAPPLR